MTHPLDWLLREAAAEFKSEPITIEDLTRYMSVAFKAGEVKEGVPITTEGTSSPPGAMLAFMLDKDESALLGSIGDYIPDHMTLIFVSDDVSKVSEDGIATLKYAIGIFSKQSASFDIAISGVGRFETDEGDSRNAVYASVDSPSLPGFRQKLLDVVRTSGIEPVLTHGFSPHITLGYIDASAPTPDVTLPLISMRLDVLSLVIAGERFDYKLEGEKEYKANNIGSVGRGQSKGILSPEQKAIHWKAIDQTAKKWEPKFADKARIAFEKNKRDILAIMKGAKDKALEAKAGIAWEDASADVKDYLEAQSSDVWRETFAPVIQGVVTAQGERWAEELGQQFNVRNLFAEEWYDNYTLQFAQQINSTTTDAMSVMLQQAQEEGWTIQQMQSNMTDMFQQWMDGDLSDEDFAWFADRMPGYRTEMIARTETMRSSNAGSNALFADWGVKNKEWLSTKDSRTRDDHAEADGQVVGIDESFDVGGEALEFPGDPNGDPANTINCRCTVLPVIQGD